MIVVDTGPIVALANDRDDHHERCRDLLERHPGPLLLPATVSRAGGRMVETYADLPLGTVDASVLALTERLGLSEVATAAEQVREAPDSSWDYTQLRFPRHEGMRIDLVRGSPALSAGVGGALIDREERKGKGKGDHAPVVVDLTD